MADARPEHSPLGASGAERWINCHGSVALLKELALPDSDEPDYRREGTALHEASADALVNSLDAWEITGKTYNRTVIDPVMGRAIQVYLGEIRKIMEEAKSYYIEYPISSPIHENFYGRADFGALCPERFVVVDLKGGEGIIVDPEDNPQGMYYAYGFIDGLEREQGLTFADEFPVDIGICQPRAYLDPKTRWWRTSVGEIKSWVHSTLVPAMVATELDNALDAGTWCRFCPAKLVCPLLSSLFRAAAVANPKEVVNISDASLDRSYHYLEAVKFYVKALEAETMRRHMTGKAELTESKLVKKKANRVYKPGAPELAQARFGEASMTEPCLKSPAELEKVSAAAAEWVKEFAYIPETGYTIAPASDRRQAIRAKPGEDVFRHYIDGSKEL
jgi:hypothetical protein